MSLNEIRAMIERKIKLLEKQLQFYKQLLELLSSCSEVSMPVLEEIRDEEGNVLARVYKIGNDVIRYVPERPLNKNSPYLRHLVKRLEKLRSEGLELSYEIIEEGDNIKMINVKGVAEHEDIIDSLLRLFKFVTLKALKSPS